MLTKCRMQQQRPTPLEQPHEKPAEVLREGREVAGCKINPFYSTKGSVVRSNAKSRRCGWYGVFIMLRRCYRWGTLEESCGEATLWIAAGRLQLTAQPPGAILQELGAGLTLPKLSLKLSPEKPVLWTMLCFSNILLRLPMPQRCYFPCATFTTGTTTKKSIYISTSNSTTDYKRNIEKILSSLYCS